jgi:hypothetical protein
LLLGVSWRCLVCDITSHAPVCFAAQRNNQQLLLYRHRAVLQRPFSRVPQAFVARHLCLASTRFACLECLARQLPERPSCLPQRSPLTA